jgi:hypothetical protein
MRKQLLTALGAIAAVTAISSSAQAAVCEGLACPGVLPASSSAHSPLLPAVAPQDLSRVRASGFYAYDTLGIDSQRAVAYVVAPGDWASAPQEIKQLPLADDLLPAEISSKWMVIYGPGAMASGPWGPGPNATAARKVKHRRITAHAAAASDCVSPWFCTFNGGTFTGTKCQWQSTGVWQTLPADCIAQASSMVNRRNAWSLMKRNTDSRNYCAIPNTQDADLSNNGFNNNVYETYNSTSTTKLSAWNCTN